jgi:hypothetical protein
MIDELTCVRVGRPSPDERLHVVSGERLLPEERLDYHQDVLALSRLVGEVMAVTQERDELLAVVATLVLLSRSRVHTANIHNQDVIVSGDAEAVIAINPRAKRPVKKNKKNFSQTLALTQLITYFCVVTIGQHYLLLDNRNLETGEANINRRASRQERKKKKNFQNLLTNEKLLLIFAT